MKHPRMEVLQDYFENVLNASVEKRVASHLLDCDQCTKILADFTVVETRLKRSPVVAISDNTQQRIFAGASELLAEKRRVPEPSKLLAFWEEWKEVSFPEFKTPALQLCSLSVVLFVLVAVEKEQSRHEEIFMPLSDEVQVLTYKDIEEST